MIFAMVMTMLAPFGSWESPITPETIVQDSIRFYDMSADEKGLYWTELHPKEKGRLALVHFSPAEGEKSLLPETSVRTRVHEYGGGAFCTQGGNVFYSNDEDGQIYRLNSQGEKTKLTDRKNMYFADGTIASDGRRSIWVGEEHGKTVENFLVLIDENGVKTLTAGHDFYASPRLSPDGKQLAFFTWDHPDLPWDASTLWLADFDERGELHNLRAIAGGVEESICQIAWSKEGILHYVSDEGGFWNLYRFQDECRENLCPMEGEFGVPHWVFGRPTYVFLEDGKILTSCSIKGIDRLGLIDPKEKTFTDLNLEYTLVQNLVLYEGKAYFFGGSPTQTTILVSYDLKTEEISTVKESISLKLDLKMISQGESIEYASYDGGPAYAFYYPPKNPNFESEKGEKPPLIVRAHSGPTGRTYSYLMLDIQYWTSRGYAFLDVNYGGSTGYGRKYFKRLESNWGVLDVEDCVRGAQALVDRGLVDPKRMVIRGGSAGGYTVLASLAFKDVFAGGTSYFGVSDLELMYQDTHKFEAKYTDRLVAPYPEELEKIRERSPIHHIDQLNTPLLLLQGAEDKIVPPNQAEVIYEGLKTKGTPVGMLIFEGEGHGFRQAPNIKKAYEAEEYFYGKILGLDLGKRYDLPPVEIIE